MRRAHLMLLSAILFCSTIALILPEDAQAGRSPERVFAGNVITSKTHIPTRAKSANAYIRTLRKLKTRQFWENTETKEWKIYFAAFFRKPLNDLEITIKLYDVTGGQPHLKSSFQQFLGTRGQKSVVSHLKLSREHFGVNRQILMVVENRGRTLATGKFKILGKQDRPSGNVVFTEEEAAGH
ncbi:MAG TPA: hypothetical protein VFG83_13140 [Kofleriaceae bacterium]|nr:hypothetical protein [Kofleriaceae bacterium]